MVDSERAAAARAAMRSAIDAIDHAYEQAVVAFDSIDDVEEKQAAFELANELSGRLELLGGKAGQLKRRCIRRIWDTEELTLRSLADRVGLSKTRADQLVQAFKKEAPADQEETPHV